MSWILLGNPSATSAGLDEVKLGRMFMEVFWLDLKTNAVSLMVKSTLLMP